MRWQSFLDILPGKKIIALFHTTNIKNMISLIKSLSQNYLSVDNYAAG
jgi:hypothetical protein